MWDLGKDERVMRVCMCAIRAKMGALRGGACVQSGQRRAHYEGALVRDQGKDGRIMRGRLCAIRAKTGAL